MRVFLTGAAILFAVFVVVPLAFAALGVAAAIGFAILKFVLVAMLVGWIATRLFGRGSSSRGWCGGNRHHQRHNHRQRHTPPVESRRMSREEWEWEHFLDEARTELDDIDRSRRVQ